jgi:hypothetical protein
LLEVELAWVVVEAPGAVGVEEEVDDEVEREFEDEVEDVDARPEDADEVVTVVTAVVDVDCADPEADDATPLLALAVDADWLVPADVLVAVEVRVELAGLL